MADLENKEPTAQEKNEEKEMVKIIENAKKLSKRNCKSPVKTLLDIAPNLITQQKLTKPNGKLFSEISLIDHKTNPNTNTTATNLKSKIMSTTRGQDHKPINQTKTEIVISITLPTPTKNQTITTIPNSTIKTRLKDLLIKSDPWDLYKPMI